MGVLIPTVIPGVPGVYLDPAANRVQLPDGYYLPLDIADLRWQLNISRFCLVTVVGAIYWDYIVTFPEELARWQQLLQRKITLVGVLVLVARYASIAATGCMLLWQFNDSTELHCQLLIDFVYGLIGLAYICLSFIFVIRLRSLWLGEEPRWMRPLVAALLVWTIGMRIFSIVGVHGKLAVPAARFRHYPSCLSDMTKGYQWVGWLGAAGFDIFAYALTILRIRALSKGLSRNASALIRFRSFVWTSSTVYFLVSFCSNLGCTISLIVQRNVLLQQIPVIFTALVNYLIACRIVFHSDLFTEGKTGLLVLDPRSRHESVLRKASRQVLQPAVTPKRSAPDLRPSFSRTRALAQPIDLPPFSQVSRRSVPAFPVAWPWPHLRAQGGGDDEAAQAPAENEDPVSDQLTEQAERSESISSHQYHPFAPASRNFSRRSPGEASAADTFVTDEETASRRNLTVDVTTTTTTTTTTFDVAGGHRSTRRPATQTRQQRTNPLATTGPASDTTHQRTLSRHSSNDRQARNALRESNLL